jgi:serine/threonine protein kinase
LTITAGTRLGRYETRSTIGAGGMGEVYLAEDIRLHRKVALKVLPAAVASNQDRMRQTAKRSSPPTRAAEPNCGS